MRRKRLLKLGSMKAEHFSNEREQHRMTTRVSDVLQGNISVDCRDNNKFFCDLLDECRLHFGITLTAMIGRESLIK